MRGRYIELLHTSSAVHGENKCDSVGALIFGIVRAAEDIAGACVRTIVRELDKTREERPAQDKIQLS